MKILSVVVPAYNMERYLSDCLDSLSGEALSDAVEVIVVDDGSTDGTARIALEYAARDPARFRLIKKPNGGHGSAVNAGIASAVGRYVRVVDADDMIYEDGLLRVIGEMRASGADLIVDERVRFKDDGLNPIRDTFPESLSCGSDLVFLETVTEDTLPFLNMHTISARRDFFMNAGVRLLENTFYVDFQYAFLLLMDAGGIRFVRETVYRYRVGNEGQSVHYLWYVRRYEDHDLVLKSCVRAFSESNIYDARRDALLTRMLQLLLHTQYKIALLFNPDRREGRRQARTLKAAVAEACGKVERRARRRYFTALSLNLTGLNRLLLKRFRGYTS